jgi:hypothetical protein
VVTGSPVKNLLLLALMGKSWTGEAERSASRVKAEASWRGTGAGAAATRAAKVVATRVLVNILPDFVVGFFGIRMIKIQVVSGWKVAD